MAERDANGYLIAPDGGVLWELRGRVTSRIVNEGTPMARRVPVVLEQEPGGQFLALHGDDGLDVHAFVDRYVVATGRIWMQSFQATAIVEAPEDR